MLRNADWEADEWASIVLIVRLLRPPAVFSTPTTSHLGTMSDQPSGQTDPVPPASTQSVNTATTNPSEPGTDSTASPSPTSTGSSSPSSTAASSLNNPLSPRPAAPNTATSLPPQSAPSAPTPASTVPTRPGTSIPVHPFPGLPLDLRAKSDGNGTDRDWLELPKATKAATGTAAPAASVDDGNMLITLCGSDVHHSLFLSSVAHTHPFRFVSTRPPFVFPRAKASRASYEGYVPDGIMRSHWVVKHKYVIPSVALVCCDWADSAPSYEQQETDARMRLAKVRMELQHRDTRIVMLLVRQQRFSSAEEEAALIDRVTRGIKRAGIDAPYRTVLPFIVADPKASCKRVEAALYDISLDYYKSAIKRLRALKTRISRSQQQLLYVRHQMKAGYFSEAIKDMQGAIKHYGHAYTALATYTTQLSSNILASTLSHELKQVGLVLDYRLCRLYLSLQRYSDALEQFNQHIAVMKRAVGISDLLFSHYQYLSQQYHLFGDLLEQSNYHSTQRSKQFHAGYFYQTAATYAQKRKQYAQSLLTKIRNGTATNLPSLVPAATLAPSAFLGQARLPYGSAALQDDRGVLGYSTMYVSSDPVDLLRSVVSLEQSFDHSAQIIGLLNRSYDSYKREHSDRMIVHVASQIAAEYFSARNWEMAQKFFDRIAATYREEQWWTILTSTLMAAYHCAKELGKDMPSRLSDQEAKVAKCEKEEQKETEKKRYEALLEQCRQLPRQLISYALELIGKYATTTTEQKEKIHTHLVEVLTGGGGVIPEYATDALDAVYELPVKYRLVECDAYFLTTPASVVYVLQPIDLVLKLDYRFPLPVTAQRIELQFNHPQYTLTLSHDGSPAAQLTDDEDGSDKGAAEAASATPILLQADNDGQVTTSLHFTPNRTKTFHVKLPARTPTTSPLAITHLVSHLLLRGMSGEQTRRSLRLRSWPNRREDEEVMRPVYGLEEVVVETSKEKKKKKKALENRSEAEKEEERRKLREEEEARARALSMKLAAVAIVPPLPAAVLSISHPSPPLLNEYYPLRVCIETKADEMRDARLTVSSVDLQAAAAEKVTVDGLATQHVEGVEGKTDDRREEKEETKEDDSSPAARHARGEGADVTRFYTLSRPTTKNAHVDATELTEVTGPLTVPNMHPNATYYVTLYVRLSSSAPHHVFLDLSYQSRQFELSKREQLSMTAKPALTVKVKLFSERSISTPATLPPEGRLVALGDRCVLHVELDNVSSHALGVTDVRLDLAQQSVLELAEPSLWGGADRLTGGRLQDASALFASRHTSSALLKPNASVFLSPGERYLHLFHFTAARAGRLTAAAVGIQWCRVQVDLAVHRQHVAVVPIDAKAAGHALSEKQRDDLLKRLVEEQKVRAGGEQKTGPDTVRENGDRTIPHQPDGGGEHKPPAADEAAVSDALKRELKEVEEEEKESREDRKAQEEMVDTVTIQKPPATPTASVTATTLSAADTAPSSSPCIPVELRQPLPTLTVAVPPVTVELLAPPVASFGAGFALRLSLRNNTGAVHEVEYAVKGDGVEGGAKVLVAGSTAGVCRLFPHSTAEVLWSCVALETGFVPLPALSAQLLSGETGQQTVVLVNPDEVGSVFVRTREKREQPRPAS